MAITIVQQKVSTVQASATTATVTFTSAVTKGNTVVIGYVTGTRSNPTSVNQETWDSFLDAAGACPTLVAGVGMGHVLRSVGGYTVITITWAAANGSCQTVGYELAGAEFLESAVFNNGTSATLTATTITPHAGNGFYAAIGNINAVFSSGPTGGYTDDGHASNVFAHLISTDSSAHGTTWTSATSAEFATSHIGIAAQAWPIVVTSQPPPPQAKQPNYTAYANDPRAYAISQLTGFPAPAQLPYPQAKQPNFTKYAVDPRAFAIFQKTEFSFFQPVPPPPPKLTPFANNPPQQVAAPATPNVVVNAQGIVLPLPPKQTVIAGRPPFPLSIANPYWPIPYIGRASDVSDILPSNILRLIGDVGPR